jgi:hypothetical protein
MSREWLAMAPSRPVHEAGGTGFSRLQVACPWLTLFERSESIAEGPVRLHHAFAATKRPASDLRIQASNSARIPPDAVAQ